MGKRKLSQKERNEPVTKGYLHDTLENTLKEKDYVTKTYLEEVLEKKDYVTKQFLMEQNYVTKDYMHEAFDSMDRKLQHYVKVIMEDNRSQTLKLIDAFESRFERIGRHVGLA